MGKTIRQVGAYLNSSSGLINSGIGPFYILSTKFEHIHPTETFDKSMSIQIAGEFKINFQINFVEKF